MDATPEVDIGVDLKDRFVHRGMTWRGTQIGDGPLPMGQSGTGWTHFEAAYDGSINLQYSPFLSTKNSTVPAPS